MVGAIDRIGGLTSRDPLLTEWGSPSINLPKAVIPDPSGQPYTGIKFDGSTPSFNTNYQPISPEHLSTSLSGAMKNLNLSSNPLEPLPYNPEEFATSFVSFTKGLPTGQVIHAY